jgi:hypothetical protein
MRGPLETAATVSAASDVTGVTVLLDPAAVNPVSRSPRQVGPDPLGHRLGELGLLPGTGPQ